MFNVKQLFYLQCLIDIHVFYSRIKQDVFYILLLASIEKKNHLFLKTIDRTISSKHPQKQQSVFELKMATTTDISLHVDKIYMVP